MTHSTAPHRPTKPAVSRRQFLRIIAASAAAGVMLKSGWEALDPLEKASETRLLMGTLVNLTVVGAPSGGANNAVRACLDRMAALERIFSRYQPGSQLSQLNRSGYLEQASPELLQVLALADQVSRWSSGAFDITVKPLVDLYFEKQAAHQPLPSARELAEARRLVDYQGVRVDGSRVTLDRPGMGLTLDGVAKGYIVDAGVAVLRQLGFANVLVEAGGDLLASGEGQPGKRAWQIGIQSPRRSQPGRMARLSARDQAIATSGDYLQAFTADFSSHHIIDPRSGRSCPELASATVAAPSAALADALATSVMVLGLAQGRRLIEKLPGCSAYLVSKDMAVTQTGGFPISE